MTSILHSSRLVSAGHNSSSLLSVRLHARLI